MWPQASPSPSQMAYGANGAQQQQQAQQQQAQQQQQTPQAQQQSAANQQATAAAGGVANVGGATDPHNYNNIGSILTNLIDNNPNPMEYNFELMQQGSVPVSGGAGSTAAAAAQSQQQQQQQQQSALSVQHHQQQQQHQAASAAASAYGLQPAAGAGGLIRHAGVYGAPASLYDPHHHPAHHASSLAEMGEQQKNSFQPYHPHALQSHAHALGGHPLAPTAHHPLAAASHLLPPPPPHAGHHVYDRGGYSVLGGEDAKAVLPPISDYMHHMQQQHVQQPDLLYYPVKND